MTAQSTVAEIKAEVDVRDQEGKGNDRACLTEPRQEPSPFRCTQSVNQASVLFRVKKVALGTKPTPTPDTEIRTRAGRINILPQTTARAGWTTAFPIFPRVSDQWVMTRASDEINLVFSHLANTSTRLNKALSASACNSETSGNSDCT